MTIKWVIETSETNSFYSTGDDNKRGSVEIVFQRMR